MGFFRRLRPGVGQLGNYKPRPLDVYVLKSKATLNDFPKISIVVPSFNQGAFIGSTLESIINQRYPNLELIVVDGGSTDNTLDVIKFYENQIDWWVSEQDSGQAAAINKGFSNSSGSIMAWVNSDDQIVPGALNFVAEYFHDNNEVEVVYGDRIVIDENGLDIGRWIIPNHSFKVLKYADFIPQETLYWTRKAWDKVGGCLDEEFQFAMDWDFLLRLSKNGAAIAHLPVFLGLFRVHINQKTSNHLYSVGQNEMARLRVRELGFEPTFIQLMVATMPFLLTAKLSEIIRKIFPSERCRN